MSLLNKRQNTGDFSQDQDFQNSIHQVSQSHQQPQVGVNMASGQVNYQKNHLVVEDCNILVKGQQSKIDFLSFDGEDQLANFPMFADLQNEKILPAQTCIPYLQSQFIQQQIQIIRGWVFFNENTFYQIISQSMQDQMGNTSYIVQFQSQISGVDVFIYIIRFDDLKNFQNGEIYPKDVVVEDLDRNNKMAFIACIQNNPMQLQNAIKLDIIYTFNLVPSPVGQIKIGTFMQEYNDFQKQQQQIENGNGNDQPLSRKNSTQSPQFQPQNNAQQQQQAVGSPEFQAQQPPQQQQQQQQTPNLLNMLSMGNQPEQQQQQQQQQIPAAVPAPGAAGTPGLSFDLFGMIQKNTEQKQEEIKLRQEEQKKKLVQVSQQWQETLDKYEDQDIPEEIIANMVNSAKFYVVRSYSSTNSVVAIETDTLPLSNQTFASLSKHIQMNQLIVIFLFQFRDNMFESIDGCGIIRNIVHDEDEAKMYDISKDDTTWEQCTTRPLEKTVPIKWLRKNQLKLEHIQNMKNAKNKTSVHLQYEGNELDQVTGKTLVQMLENPPIVRQTGMMPNPMMGQPNAPNPMQMQMMGQMNNPMQQPGLNPMMIQQQQMLSLQIQQQMAQFQQMMVLAQGNTQAQQQIQQQIDAFQKMMMMQQMSLNNPAMNMQSFQNMFKLAQRPQQREDPKEGDGNYVYRCPNWPKCQTIQGVSEEMSKKCSEYRHPNKVCKYFPKCLKGNKCVNLHPNDGKYYRVALSKFRKKQNQECPNGILCPNQEHCSNTHPNDKEYSDADLRCFKYPDCQEGEKTCMLIHPEKKLCLKYPDCDKKDLFCNKLHPSDGKYFRRALEKAKENCKTICPQGRRCKYEVCYYLHPGEHRFKRVLKRERKKTGKRCKYGRRCRDNEVCLWIHSSDDEYSN